MKILLSFIVGVAIATLYLMTVGREYVTVKVPVSVLAEEEKCKEWGGNFTIQGYYDDVVWTSTPLKHYWNYRLKCSKDQVVKPTEYLFQNEI